MTFDKSLAEKAALDLAGSKSAVALTGSGISVESGIPPFRGKGGVWENIDPAYAHIDTFHNDPEKVWEILLKGLKDLVDHARPNPAHEGLARMESLGALQTVITQNVDGLHQMAGNTDVIEFHGSFAWHKCMDCGSRCPNSGLDLNRLPPRCDCGGIFRPELVFFGEMIPPHHLKRSEQIASECDIMLVVGTSAIVQPAALMPVIAKTAGATVIEINIEPTPLTGTISSYSIMGKAGEVISDIVAELELLMKPQ